MIRVTDAKKRGQRFAVLKLLALLILGLIFLFPLIVTFTNSFMSESEIALNYSVDLTVFDLLEGVAEKFRRMSIIPEQAGFWQYAEVLLKQPSFLVLLTNSLKITLPVTLGSLIVSLCGAYGFTAWNWKHMQSIYPSRF